MEETDAFYKKTVRDSVYPVFDIVCRTAIVCCALLRMDRDNLP